jgi:hypothetical protein
MENEIDIHRLRTDDEYRRQIKWRMQTDLFWLAKYVLGYRLISERWHREVAEAFVHKDPLKPFEQQSPRKRRRIILLSRKVYKTTFNIADTVQWILVIPDIAIMAMTASNSPDSPLADAFVAECASHFVCNQESCSHPLHICFPEHVLHRNPSAGAFTTPARKRYRRDPTVKGVSIEQSLSGWHPDIIKSEDVQDNRNSQTAFSLRKVRTNFYINLKMLGQTGLLDITGTRYGPMDLYGDMIAKAGEETILLWKPAYIRRSHALKLEDDELTEADVILQFPEQLSWEFLRSEKILDESSFWTQYMNVAEGNFKSTFPRDKLDAAKVPPEVSDRAGNLHIAWRFEYGEEKNAACAVGSEIEGRMTIVDLVRGQFTPTSLARRVVAISKKWEQKRVEIEDTPGARALLPAIRNEALEADWRMEIAWSEFLQDPTARALDVKCAEPHLLAGRLLFADNLPHGQEAFRQLYHFGMIEETEIASVIARVASKLPASIAAEGFDWNDDEQFQAYISQDAYDRVYGRGKYEEKEPVLPEQEEEWVAQQNDELSEMMPGLSG